MGLSFAQPLALWGLLGLPAILLIHFLQSRNRREEVSTLFLLDLLPEETRSGAVFSRLRNGLQLWLQLLAVLLFTLLLSRPMWLRRESAQLVAVVVDSSTSMRAFRERALLETESAIRRVDRAAGRTEWWILPSDPTRALLYRGDDTEAAVQSLSELDFLSGPHEPRPVLARLRRMLGPEGLLLWVTDHPPEEEAPAEAVALGVGGPTPNSGFTGIRFRTRPDGLTVWEASATHFGPDPVRKTVGVELEGLPPSIQELTLYPGAVARLEGVLPPEVRRGALRLESDAYGLDNQLPFVAPSVKPLPYAIDLDPDDAAWAERVMSTLPGAERSADPALRWRRMRAAPPEPRSRFEILLAGGGEPGEFAEVVAVDHPLTRDLSWAGFLGRPLSAPDTALAPGEQVLVWIGEAPLVTLRETGAGSRLALRFDLDASNADRLPAMVLMLNRYLRQARRATPGVEVVNLETRQRLDLPDRGGERLEQLFEPMDGEPRRETFTTPPERAPESPGYVTLRSGDRDLLRAGVFAGDVREADLRDASSRELPGTLLMERRKLNSQSDFLRPLWFSLLGLTLVGAWWSGARGGEG